MINTTEIFYNGSLDINGTEGYSTEAEVTGGGTATVDPSHVAVYITIGIIGMVGNSLTFFILCSSSSIRNKTINMFLISQSLLDFLCALMLVATAWQVVFALGGGHFGLAVFHKTSFTKKHAIIMILMAWLFGPLYNLARMVPTTRIRDGICVYNIVWPSQFWFSFTSIITCILYLFFPLIFITSLYLSIFLYLRKKASVGSIGEGGNQANKLDKAKTNVLKTLVALTVCFFVCWIWNISFFFLFSIGVPLKTTTLFYNFSIFMLNINCCINPFCYALQYREFQKQARKLFCRGKFGDKVGNATTENTTESTT